MKSCLACQHSFNDMNWSCPSCGWQPNIEAGVILFAPDLANDNDGFSAESFERLYAAEETNFWFRVRNKIILWFMQRYFRDLGTKSFMEVGSGTGFVLSAIRHAFPAWHVYGTEIYSKGLDHAAERVGQGAQFYQMDGKNIPFESEFDVIGAFDCLEHIDDDEQVLKEMHKALKPGGGVIFTVPQHPSLWSADDVKAHHKRRYCRGELEAKMCAAGFTVVVDSSSFVTFLLPAMYLDRLLKPADKAGAGQEGKLDGLKLPPLLNGLFYAIMMLEFYLIRMGIRFPLGGSRIVVGRK